MNDPATPTEPSQAPKQPATPTEPSQAPKVAEKTIEVRILRDTWDKKGKRLAKGRLMRVGVDAAIDGIEAGLMEKYKKPAKAK